MHTLARALARRDGYIIRRLYDAGYRLLLFGYANTRYASLFIESPPFISVLNFDESYFSLFALETASQVRAMFSAVDFRLNAAARRGLVIIA